MSTVVTVPAGSRWFDHSVSGIPPSWYARRRAEGYYGCLLDLMTGGVAADVAAARQAGLAIMLYQGYWAADFAIGAKAVTRAQFAVQFAQQVGYPQGDVLWLDWESVPKGVTTDQAIQWINAWADTAAQAGYVPGLYPGLPQPLTPDQLYWQLKVQHYWRSCSADAPAVSVRGYQLIQTACSQLVDGVEIDLDVVQADALGGLPLAWAPHPAAVTPSTTTPVPSDLEGRVADLEHQVVALSQALQQVKAGLKQAAN